MTTAIADRRTTAILLGSALALVGIEHLRALAGSASFEHLSQLTLQLMASDGFQGPNPAGETVTGGGGLVFALHWLLRQTGLPWDAAHGLYALLDAAAVAAWVLLARRWLAGTVLWASAVALALYGVPKSFLFENSTLMAFTAPVVLASVVLAARRGSLAWTLAAAVALAISTHLGLLAVFALPPCLWVAWRSGMRRRGLAAGVLVAGAFLPILPIWAGTGGENPVFEELVIRFSPAHLGHTLAGIFVYLWSFLSSPLLLASLVIVALVPRKFKAAMPHLGLALLWLAATAIPAAILDPFKEPYHFAMASPARALVIGYGFYGLGAVARRWLGDRFAWDTLLLGASVVAFVGSAAGTLSNFKRGGGDLAESVEEVPCTSWDEGCDRRSTRQLLDHLDTSGLMPAPGGRVDFHGVYSYCLDAAWYWRYSQLDPAHRSDASEIDHILLVPDLDDVDIGELDGADRVGDLFVFAGVIPVDAPEDWEDDSPAPFTLILPPAEDGLIYVGVETTRMFLAPEVAQTRAGAEAAPLASCDHEREDGSMVRYDGFYLLDPTLTPGEDDLVVDVDPVCEDCEPPEHVVVLRIPGSALP